MGFDSTDHEQRGGTARSPQPPDDEATEEFIWYEAVYGWILVIIGTAAAVIGLNIVVNDTGGIGPVTTVRLAAAGLVVIGVGLVVIGVKRTLTIRVLSVPFDRVSLGDMYRGRDTDLGMWTALHSALFLMFSTVFLFAGASTTYQAVTSAVGPDIEGVVLGVLLLGCGVFLSGAALAALFGVVWAPIVTGGIGLGTAVFGGWMMADVLVVGVLFAVPAAIGVVLAWRAHLELRNTDT